MTFQRHGSILVILLLMLSLLLAACERPLPGTESVPPTPTEETGAQSGAYPGVTDLAAPGGEGDAGDPASETALEQSAADEAAAPEAYPPEAGEAAQEEADTSGAGDEAAVEAYPADAAAESAGSEETAAPEDEPAAEPVDETAGESGGEAPVEAEDGAGDEAAVENADEPVGEAAEGSGGAASEAAGSETPDEPEAAAAEEASGEAGEEAASESTVEAPEDAADETTGEAPAENETPAAADATESAGETAPDSDSTAEPAVGGDEEVVEGPRTHTVAPGENLFRIGLQYGISWVTLAEANNLTDANSIAVGQELLIPDTEAGEQGEPVAVEAEGSGEDAAAPEAVAEPESGGNTYIVQSGDNLYRISLKYGVSVTALVEANSLASADRIYAGQELVIPAQELDAVDGEEGVVITHEVQPGDTVFGVAFLYGISWTELVEANDLAAPYTLEEGQVLIIAAGE